MRLDYKWRAAITVSIGLFMAVLDNTIVSVARPQMQAYFHTDLDTINWVSTAYFLAQAAVIPITGYLSDLLGSKRVFLTALAIFTIGSALCAVAPDEHLLIGFRVLQGIGGGALFPIAFAIVFRVFPPAERGPAGAVIGVPVLLAPAFGPTIGGYLTTTFDWHAIFTINLPIGVLAFALAALVLRGRDAERATLGAAPVGRKRFDVLGLVLSMAGFTAVVYGISEASALKPDQTVRGWGDPSVAPFLIAGGVLLVAFFIAELFVSDPVMDVRLFANYTFTTANVLMWAISGFLFGSLFLLPIFFQQVQGKTPLESGELVIAQGLGAAISTVFAGRLYNRVGPRILAALGFALVTAGTYGFTQLAVDSSGQSLQVWMVLRGLGLGLTNIPLQTLALSVVSNRAMARASSLVNVMRQVFSAIGITILTTYFVTQTSDYATPLVKSSAQQFGAATAQSLSSGSPLDPTTPLGQLVGQCAAPFGPQAAQNQAAIQQCVQQHIQQQTAQATQAHLPQIVQQVFPAAATHALNDTFLITMIGCGIAIVLALFLGRDPSITAARRAAATGEVVSEAPRPAMVAE